MAKRGRKTKYKRLYCKRIVDYFDIEPYEKIELPHYQSDGETLKWMDYKLIPARMPSLIRFAKNIGVSYQTVRNWVEAHRDFFEAFTHAKEIRKEWLINLGLSGLTAPLAYKFTAINVTDMVDEKVVKSNDDDKLTSEERKNLRKMLEERQIPLRLVKGA